MRRILWPPTSTTRPRVSTGAGVGLSGTAQPGVEDIHHGRGDLTDRSFNANDRNAIAEIDALVDETNRHDFFGHGDAFTQKTERDRASENVVPQDDTVPPLAGAGGFSIPEVRG